LVLNDQVTEAIQICREKTKGDQTAHAAIVLASALTEATTFGEKNEAADAFLKSALDAHADDTKLLYAVGTLRAVQGRFDEATRLYRLVLEVEPKNIAALNNLAMMLAESPAGYVESLKLITQAIDIAGQHPGLLDTKGTILLYQGKAKEALFLLEAAAREAGQDARHRFHLAAAYHGAGDVLRAKQQLELAIDLNLDKQVLTPTDRRMLAELKTALLP